MKKTLKKRAVKEKIIQVNSDDPIKILTNKGRLLELDYMTKEWIDVTPDLTKIKKDD